MKISHGTFKGIHQSVDWEISMPHGACEASLSHTRPRGRIRISYWSLHWHGANPMELPGGYGRNLHGNAYGDSCAIVFGCETYFHGSFVSTGSVYTDVSTAA